MLEIFNELFDDNFIKLTMSNKKDKSYEYKKIVIEDLKKYYQISSYTDQQVYHQNVEDDILAASLQLVEKFKQIDILKTDQSIKILISKKGKISVIKKQQTNQKQMSSHNKQKNYLIKEGEYLHWLYKLDIMDAKGTIKPSKQKKFKQINKFLENVEALKTSFGDTINIVDIGCGKSYLTFAIYHYLNELGYNVNVLGIDLKAKVIENCQALSEECGFTNLTFVCADIFDYNIEFSHVDLVVGLHACDIATDFALYNAIKLKANNILAVPCCQHQLNQTIKNDNHDYLLRHGIFKERFSSMLTDSIRAMLLEAYGYNVVVAEFIEMEFTAKNVLLKASKKNNCQVDHQIINKVKLLLEEYHIEQKLYDLLLELEK